MAIPGPPCSHLTCVRNGENKTGKLKSKQFNSGASPGFLNVVDVLMTVLKI